LKREETMARTRRGLRETDDRAEIAGDAEVLPVDRDVQTATRAAWLYYIEGQTQEQIAHHLGINRIRINRILAAARDSGIVQVRINTPLASCVALERELCRRFDISEAVVVPSPVDPENVRRLVAAAGGALLSERVREDMSIGVGWGRTLRLSLNSVERRPIPNLRIVSLMGGLTRGSVMNSYEAALRLADLFGAECFYIAGPAFTDSEESRDLLMNQAMLKDAFEHARHCDLVYISVGGLDMETSMARLGLIGEDDLDTLRQVGAVGDICGYWVDADGAIVDHPLNRRVLAVDLDCLTTTPEVMLVTGGPGRDRPIRAALRRGYVDTLVTDEDTAASILALEDAHAGAAP
jgi:DNA-binding transcriptional regulator LsrR (DeoR family)